MKGAFMAFALLFAASRCEAALSPRQLGAAALAPEVGAQLPPEAPFETAQGPLTLKDAIGGKPAILLLVDFTCRFICGSTLSIAADGLSHLNLRPGADYAILVMGIDPKDDVSAAEAMKRARLGAYPQLAASARFLNGDAATVAAVAAALHYTPVYDAETDEFAHPVGAVILTPDARVSGVVSGLDLDASSLKAALDAAGQRGGSGLIEGIRLLCYGHAPLKGAYAATVGAALIAGGTLTFALLCGALVFLFRRGSARAS